MRNVSYGNGASTWYTYDEANRLESIDHRNGLGVTVGVTSFTYDSRSRLTREYRTLSDVYDLTYEYDQGGNRSRKSDMLNDCEVVYDYDNEDVVGYLYS